MFFWNSVLILNTTNIFTQEQVSLLSISSSNVNLLLLICGARNPSKNIISPFSLQTTFTSLLSRRLFPLEVASQCTTTASSTVI
jgi:hypothetical protein